MCVHKSKGKTLKKRFSKKRGLGERKKKKKTTNLSQRHRQLSSILIPTSQQFDTEWFVFFFFGFPPFAIEVATQVKSSIVSCFFFFFQQILRVQKSRKAKRSREQARTRKEQTNKGEKKSQWKNQETREIAKIINTFVSAPPPAAPPPPPREWVSVLCSYWLQC
jgi:hypothetical protein